MLIGRADHDLPVFIGLAAVMQYVIFGAILDVARSLGYLRSTSWGFLAVAHVCGIALAVVLGWPDAWQ
jgi:hypothetical protein